MCLNYRYIITTNNSKFWHCTGALHNFNDTDISIDAYSQFVFNKILLLPFKNWHFAYKFMFNVDTKKQ